MTDAPHVNRMPAGSPDGGKFAPGAGGAEADAAILGRASHVLDAKAASDIIRNVNLYGKHTGNLGERAFEAAKQERKAAVDASVVAVRSACPEAQSIQWVDEDPDSQDGEAVMSTVACAHTHGNQTDTGEWFSEHGVAGLDKSAFDGFSNDGLTPAYATALEPVDESEAIFEVRLDGPDGYIPDRIYVHATAQNKELTKNQSSYAEFGLRVAAMLGSNTEWSGADMLEAIAEQAGRSGIDRVGDQDADNLTKWRAVADEYGFDHDDGDDYAL